MMPITHFYNVTVIDKYHFKLVFISKRLKVFYHKIAFVLGHGADGASNSVASFEKSTHNPHGNISISNLAPETRTLDLFLTEGIVLDS